MVVLVSFRYVYLPEESGPPGKAEMFVPEQWTTSKEGLLCQDEGLNPRTLWLLYPTWAPVMGFYFCSSVNKSCFPLFVLYELDEMWLPLNPRVGWLQQEERQVQRRLHTTSLHYSVFKKSASVVTTVLILNDTPLGKGDGKSWHRYCLASAVMGVPSGGESTLHRCLWCVQWSLDIRHEEGGCLHQWAWELLPLQVPVNCHPFSSGKSHGKQEWRRGKWRPLTLERTSVRSKKSGAPWKFPAPDLGGSLKLS